MSLSAAVAPTTATTIAASKMTDTRATRLFMRLLCPVARSAALMNS
jgi:hypothetical protein